MQSISIEDRAVGCLLGLTCGDALGGPVEFESRDDLDRRFPNGLRTFIGGGWLDLEPGEITDDTQMTLALARSLTADGLDMDRLASEFLAWYHSNPKDIGNTTRAALALLADGVPPGEAGTRVAARLGDRGAGNGSVMRCAPVAIRFRNDRRGLVDATIASAAITHADRRCTWGAVAVNQAIVHLLNGGGLQDLIAAAIEGVEDLETRQVVVAAPTRTRDQVESGGFVLDTVGAAFWSLLRHPSFEDAVVAAVGLGGDTDTTAAVTGALAGALHGEDAIPLAWRQQVQHREEIRALARGLALMSDA